MNGSIIKRKEREEEPKLPQSHGITANMKMMATYSITAISVDPAIRCRILNCLLNMVVSLLEGRKEGACAPLP
jgi:hypothetical protein